MRMVHYVIVAYILGQTGVSLLTEYCTKKGVIFKDIVDKTRILRISIYVLLAIIPCLGAFLPKCGFKYFCMAAGNIWLGYFIYYAGLLLILSGISAIICLIIRDKEKKIFAHILHFSVIAALIITVYGLIHAQSIKVVTCPVTINETEENNLKIALLGDLHLSVNSTPSTTEKMVEMVNECDADVILIAGDIFTSTYGGLAHPEKYSEALRKLKAKYGVYVVAGNHDVEENLFGGFPVSPSSEAFRTPEMDKFFEDCGFKMLYDEAVELDDGKVTLLGRVDGEKAGDGTTNRMNVNELMKNNNVSKDSVVIALEHEPMDYKELSDGGVDVVLSGHTHNGQLFPGNMFVPIFNENGYGYKKIHNIDTFVTAGVGYYGPPMRVGTDGEIMIVDIYY